MQRVGEVGEGLGGIRLLLEALDAPVAIGDDDAELVGVGDSLGGHRGDPVVGLVELAHRGEIKVGERIAGDHQE